MLVKVVLAVVAVLVVPVPLAVDVVVFAVVEKVVVTGLAEIAHTPAAVLVTPAPAAANLNSDASSKGKSARKLKPAGADRF